LEWASIVLPLAERGSSSQAPIWCLPNSAKNAQQSGEPTSKNLPACNSVDQPSTPGKAAENRARPDAECGQPLGGFALPDQVAVLIKGRYRTVVVDPESPLAPNAIVKVQAASGGSGLL